MPLFDRLVRLRPWRAWVCAFAIWGVATALRITLFPVDGRLAYGAFYPAVVAALYFCGVAPGLLVMVLSAVVGVGYLSRPTGVWSQDAPSLIGLLLFVLTSLVCAAAMQRLRQTGVALRQAQDATAEGRRELAERMLDLYDHAPCAYYSVDAHGVFCQVNAVLQDWLGCTADELIGVHRPSDFMTNESAQRYGTHFRTLIETGVLGPQEFEIQGRHGVVRRISLSASAIRDAQGQFRRSRSVMYDISELDRVRKELTAVTRQQALMLDNDLVSILKLRDRRIIWSNRASERMFGYGPGELLGQMVRVLYGSDADFEAFGQAAYPPVHAGRHYRAQQRLVKRDGTPVWVDVSGVQLDADTGETMWMALDISEMKAHQEQVEHAAFHDALTGLPNRVLLMDRLHQAIQLCRRTDECLGVCYVDLDGFKPINDRLGHAAGDEVLRTVARRLQDGVRGHDTVARVGGDEFVLLLPKLKDRAEGERILQRLAQEVARTVPLSPGSSAGVGASVGMACCPADGTSEDVLLRLADQAMYASKAAKR